MTQEENMKKKVLIVAAVAGLGYISSASAEDMHLFDIKSGKVTYAISGSANMMGMQMQTKGKKRLIFDHQGARSLTESVKIEKRSGMGGNQTTKTHTMTLMDGDSLYHVDFQNKTITKTANIGAQMLGGGNMKEKGLAMIKQMGGKKTGTDSVLGYTCDVWELMGTKQCIYKGVTLKVESNVMGVTNTEIATEAQFNIDLSDRDFKLPDFPVQEGIGAMGRGMPARKANGMAMQPPSPEDMAKMAEALKAMGAAMQNGGMNGQTSAITPQDQQKLGEAMGAVLVGAMMPQMKQQMIEQEKALTFAKGCLTDADTLKQARTCAKKVDEMMGESGEPLERWDVKTKKETLKEIESALESVACAKRANTAQAMQQCMQ
ncbi:hypothetical protein MNB_SV-4-651 [hydrothermal vent metagenome]|uniref:DUF4412 domain-containing protein n=1 Tax=hydrothermal vent metagenome TaxID=652676 RepID=A0A1W1EAB5_9ZZZZ